MKNNKILITILAACILVSCNKFLDTLPDRRTELDTPDKIAKMLVSAYPTDYPVMMFELMSDNVTDNGPLFRPSTIKVEEAYLYKNVLGTGRTDRDCSARVWQNIYKNIASANQALEALDKLGNPAGTEGIRAEALLCRAFGHFVLVNAFCIAYNPESSNTDMGIPYMEAPETTVNPVYTRGTVAGVYEKINADIEAALPLVNDTYLDQPKYHFNRRAAYAFAARFNLFYGKWAKVVTYATEAIGENPRPILRDAVPYTQNATVQTRMFAYISLDQHCIFLAMTQTSNWGLIHVEPSQRYSMNTRMSHNTLQQYFPWGGMANGYVIYGDQSVYYPKIRQITDGGQTYVIFMAFTADETLACRAEAYAMLGRFDDAARDLSHWYWRNGNRTFSKEEINVYYSIERNRSPRYPMASRFNMEPGMQENLVRAALAIRRLEGVHSGYRWLDVKRHGITINRPVLKSQTEADTIKLLPYSNLTAIQLPEDVIYAGLPANPR